MGPRNSRKTTAAVCALVAAMVMVTGCAKDSGKPKASSTNRPKPKTTATGADASSQKQSAGGATFQDAVSRWVTAVIEDRPRDACMVMGTSATGSTPAKPNTAAVCDGDGAEARQWKKTARSLRLSFTPKHPKKPTTVKVAEAAPKGKEVTVPGDKIDVDGETLQDVVLSNSTGLDKGDLSVKLKVTEMSSRWYVTDMNLHVG